MILFGGRAGRAGGLLAGIMAGAVLWSGTVSGGGGSLSLRLPSAVLADSLEGAGDKGPRGFPTGPALEAIEQGQGGSAAAPPGKPVNPAWGPSAWIQEGGSETRNPYFSPPAEKGRGPVPPSARTPADITEKPSDLSFSPKAFESGLRDALVPDSWTRTFGTTPLEHLAYRFIHQPIVVSGRVILSSTRGRVVCLDAVSGATLWESRLPESVWAPAVAKDGTLYVASGNPYVTASHMMGYAQTRTIRRGNGPGHLYALSLATGKILWTAPVPGPVLGSPALAGDTLWLATGAGRLAGYSLEKEKEILEMPLSSSSGWSSPLYVHHWLWLSLEGPTKLAALWPDRKRTVWALSVPPSERLVLFTPTPSFGAKRLVTLFRSLGKDGPVEELAVVSAVTGHVFHQVRFGGAGPPPPDAAKGQPGLPPYARVYEGMAGVSVAGTTALSASDLFDQAMAVDIVSGRLFWSVPLPSRPSGPGTAVGGLYVLPLADRIAYLELASGKKSGKTLLPGPPSLGSPPVVGDTLYFSGRDGTVRAVSLEDYRRVIHPPSPKTASGIGGRNNAGDAGAKGDSGP